MNEDSAEISLNLLTWPVLLYVLMLKLFDGLIIGLRLDEVLIILNGDAPVSQ